ncbi:MAG: zf-HC2 domain-containing protein [Peptostreptococcales bacterium]|jgi:hypothetical protein
MNCNDVINNISLYIDEQLEPDQSEEIRMHLNSCSACFHVYEQLLINKETLNQVPSLPLPAGFQESLHDRLIMEKKSNHAKKWKRYGLIAALFLIGLVSVLQKDLILDKVGLGKGQENIDHYRMLASHDEKDSSMDVTPVDPGSTGDRFFTMSDNSAENSEKSIVSRTAPEEEQQHNIMSPMTSVLRDEHIDAQEEEIAQGSIAMIIQDSMDNLSDYLDKYTGPTNIGEKIFEAALDSATPELEISVPMEEFDSVFNFIAEYEKTVDYMQLESSNDLVIYKNKENTIIIIIDKY